MQFGHVNMVMLLVNMVMHHAVARQFGHAVARQFGHAVARQFGHAAGCWFSHVCSVKLYQD